jgi:hypothetical protein
MYRIFQYLILSIAAMGPQQPRPDSPGLSASSLFADWSLPPSPRAAEADRGPLASTTALDAAMDPQQPQPDSPGFFAASLFADWTFPPSPRAAEADRDPLASKAELSPIVTEADQIPPTPTTAPSPRVTEESRTPSPDYDARVEEGIQLANAMFQNHHPATSDPGLPFHGHSRTGGFRVQPGRLDLYDTRPLEQEPGEDLESYYLRFKGALLQSTRHKTLCRSSEFIGMFVLGLYDTQIQSWAIAHRVSQSASLDGAYRQVQAAETHLRRQEAYGGQQTYYWPQQPIHRHQAPDTTASWDTPLPTPQYPGGLGQPWTAQPEPRYRRRGMYPKNSLESELQKYHGTSLCPYSHSPLHLG